MPLSVIPPSETLRRIFAFERAFARRQATRVTPVPGGIAVLNDRYPASYEHNRLIVDEPAEPGLLVAAADEVIGDLGGLPYRQINTNLQFPTEEAELYFAHPLAVAGYYHLVHQTLVHTGAAPDRPARTDVAVSRVPADTLRPAVLHRWNSEMPEGIGEWNRQLTDRRLIRPAGADPARGGRVEFLAILGDTGVPRAWCDLYLERDRPGGGIAQIEDVVTVPRWRNHGYCRALVLGAVELARAAGCDLVYLHADDDDWPHQLYRRLGFAEMGSKVHVFQRVPDRATTLEPRSTAGHGGR